MSKLATSESLANNFIDIYLESLSLPQLWDFYEGIGNLIDIERNKIGSKPHDSELTQQRMREAAREAFEYLSGFAIIIKGNKSCPLCSHTFPVSPTDAIENGAEVFDAWLDYHLWGTHKWEEISEWMYTRMHAKLLNSFCCKNLVGTGTQHSNKQCDTCNTIKPSCQLKLTFGAPTNLWHCKDCDRS